MPQGAAEAAAQIQNQLELTNVFSALEIQQTSNHHLEDATARPTKLRNDQATYTTKLQMSPHDVLIEFSELMASMNDMREYIKTVWSRYAQKTVDLTVAALVTNTAHELVRHMIDDFEDKIKDPVDYEQLTFGYFKMCCEAEGLGTDENVPLNKDNLTWDDDTYRAAEKSYFFVNSFVCLISREIPEAGKAPKEQVKARNDAVESFIQNVPQSPGFEKAKKDASLLYDSFRGLFFDFMTKHRPIFDETSHRIGKCISGGVPLFDSAFAAQVSLDVTSIIEDHDRPWEELETHLSLFASGLTTYLSSHANLQCENLTNEVLEGIKDFLENIQAFQQYAIPNVHFRKSPVFIGLLLFYFRHTYYQLGLNVANGWFCVIVCAHLVNAMKVSQQLEKGWLDIKCAQELLGLERFFVGGEAPTHADSVKSKFRLACGVSPVAFARGGVRPQNDSEMMSNRGARVFKDTCHIHERFVGFLSNKIRLPLSLDQLEQVIQRNLRPQSNWRGSEGLQRINKIEKDRKKKIQERTAGSRIKHAGSSRSNSQEVSPERTMEHLLQAVQYESAIVQFPYLNLHCECFTMLRDIIHSCGPAIPGYREGLYAGGNNFCVFALDLLDTTFDRPANTTPMELAARIVSRHIENGSTASSFSTMKLLQGGELDELYEYDLKGNEALLQLEHSSLKEDSLWYQNFGAGNCFVIRNGNWYPVKKKQAKGKQRAS